MQGKAGTEGQEKTLDTVGSSLNTTGARSPGLVGSSLSTTESPGGAEKIKGHKI